MTKWKMKEKYVIEGDSLGETFDLNSTYGSMWLIKKLNWYDRETERLRKENFHLRRVKHAIENLKEDINALEDLDD